jgi:hypothetical protein
MRCEDTSAQLADYLAGSLTDSARKELENHARSCEACRDELNSATEMWQRLGDIPAAAPNSSAMRAGFDAMLTEYERVQERTAPPSTLTAGEQRHITTVRARGTSWLRRHRNLHPLFQACAAALLLVAGIHVGRELAPPTTAPTDVSVLRQEVRDLRQMVTLSLMQQQSASERLKGVSWSGQLDRPGNEVVAALIDTLMHDANVNVRLASIDALKRFAEREAVRSAAVRALDTQTSPLVQMALIDFVVETQEREALGALRRLSRDGMVNEAVRARATWGIDHLEAA